MTTDQWALGRRITQARIAAGLSKRAAARAAGLSEARWRHIESGFEVVRGEKYPTRTTPETVARVASALHLDLAEMLEIAGFDPDSVANAPVGIGHESIDISGLADADIEKVHAFVRFLKSEAKRE